MTQVDHVRMANAIRGLAMDAVEKAKSGHPGLPMGAADMATVLFTQFPEIRCGQPRLAGPRPLRTVGRPRLDAALRAALSHRRQGDDARSDQAFPPGRFTHAGPSGKFPHQGHRDHHRSARPGHRDRGRHGAGGEDAGRGIRQEDRRPPYLRTGLRRRPDGRRLAGSDRARRSLAAQQDDRALRRQRHFDRRPDLDFQLGRSDQALQVGRLGGRTDRRPGPGGDCGCDHPRAEIQQTLADRLQDDHRLRRADQGRHRESPWRGARRRGTERRQGKTRHFAGAVLGAGRRAQSLARGGQPRRRGADGMGSALCRAWPAQARRIRAAVAA